MGRRRTSRRARWFASGTGRGVPAGASSTRWRRRDVPDMRNRAQNEAGLRQSSRMPFDRHRHGSVAIRRRAALRLRYDVSFPCSVHAPKFFGAFFCTGSHAVRLGGCRRRFTMVKVRIESTFRPDEWEAPVLRKYHVASSFRSSPRNGVGGVIVQIQSHYSFYKETTTKVCSKLKWISLLSARLCSQHSTCFLSLPVSPTEPTRQRLLL
jgi:hypothetical protein